MRDFQGFLRLFRGFENRKERCAKHLSILGSTQGIFAILHYLFIKEIVDLGIAAVGSHDRDSSDVTVLASLGDQRLQLVTLPGGGSYLTA